MKKKCENCHMEMISRTDKSFCSTYRKNAFNNNLSKATKTVIQEVDGYLHGNREILKIIIGNSSKDTIDGLILGSAGFRFDYMTGIYFNKDNQLYRILYDYAWMEFSDQKVLIIRKTTI